MPYPRLYYWMLLPHQNIFFINHWRHLDRTPVSLCIKVVLKKETGRCLQWEPAWKLHLPTICFLFMSFSLSLSVPHLEVWERLLAGMRLPHAKLTNNAFLSKSPQAEESCTTMCLWVIFIVSVAAHRAERGKDTVAIWAAAFAKDQLCWRRELHWITVALQRSFCWIKKRRAMISVEHTDMI